MTFASSEEKGNYLVCCHVFFSPRWPQSVYYLSKYMYVPTIPPLAHFLAFHLHVGAQKSSKVVASSQCKMMIKLLFRTFVKVELQDHRSPFSCWSRTWTAQIYWNILSSEFQIRWHVQHPWWLFTAWNYGVKPNTATTTEIRRATRSGLVRRGGWNGLERVGTRSGRLQNLDDARFV